MTYPNWITTANLGIYTETYDFSVDPIVISFVATTGSQVTQLNGNLPLGLSWTATSNSVIITGESIDIATRVLSQITWRIRDPNDQVADRTFYLRIDPVAVPPDWTGQSQDLGYAASSGSSTYQVQAHSAYGTVTYGFASFVPPQGMSIDARTGLITYHAPAVTADEAISFTLRATAAGLSSNLACSIALLTVPHAPAWITKSGLIAEVSDGNFLELQLEAYDSSGAVITYALVSSSPSWPFTLTSTGLAYGTVPTTYTETVYQFTVSATSINGSTNRTFDVISSPITVGSLLYWTGPSDLGTVPDGEFTVLNCSATSSRGNVRYNLVGGILPRGMVLGQANGQISGFMEFQTRTRDYTFNITASDSVQTIERSFTVTVQRIFNYQYLGMTIPIEGSLKDIYYDYVGSVLDQRWIPNAESTPQSLQYAPYVQLINGLNYQIDSPATAVNFANLYLNTTELMIGSVTNVNTSPSTTLFYSPILDSNAGAAAQYASADQQQAAAQVISPSNAVQLGPIEISFSGSLPTWYSSVVPGTVVRLVDANDSQSWMQGSVLRYSSYTLTFQSTITSGSSATHIVNQWDLQLAPTYPPSLVNMRNTLIAGLGWVNDGLGQGTLLTAYVDPVTTGLSGVLIDLPGSGYLYGPSLSVAGSGNGAVAGANLTIVSCSIHFGGSAWQVGQNITLDPPAVVPAVVTVSGVDAGGAITSLTITDGGEYAIWPAGLTTMINGLGLPAEVQFDLGLGNTYVISSGTGYTVGSTTVSTTGSEPLPSWQQGTWSPYLSMGNVFTQYGGQVVGRETAAVTSTMDYQRWPLQHAILELQGINWTGDTTFDQFATAFDGGTTFFAEWTEPSDTIFDGGLEIFNQNNTRFDGVDPAWQNLAYANWGRTQFDQEQTIFDLYSTLFDPSAIPTHSVTLLRHLLRITTQQISGHDVVV